MTHSRQWKALTLQYAREQSPRGAFALSPDFLARFEGPDAHTVELGIRSTGTRPICDEVRIRRNPALPPITGDELRLLPLRDMVAEACAYEMNFAFAPLEPRRVDDRNVLVRSGKLDPEWNTPEDADRLEDTRADVRRRFGRRTTPTREFLEMVVAVLEEEQGNVTAAAEKLGYSRGHVHKLRNKAQAAGLLPQ